MHTDFRINKSLDPHIYDSGTTKTHSYNTAVNPIEIRRWSIGEDRKSSVIRRMLWFSTMDKLCGGNLKI